MGERRGGGVGCALTTMGDVAWDAGDKGARRAGRARRGRAICGATLVVARPDDRGVAGAQQVRITVRADLSHRRPLLGESAALVDRRRGAGE